MPGAARQRISYILIDKPSFLVPKALDPRYEHSTTFTETLIHLLKGYIGAGMYAMGDGFKNAGFAIGIFGTILLGVICVYNMHLLSKLCKLIQELKEMRKCPTFPETISYAFELGPKGFSRMRFGIMKIMKTFILITQLGFCVIYVTFVSISIQGLVESHTEIRMNVRVYLLATFIPLLIVSLLHTLKFLAPVSAISLVFLMYGYFVVLGICLYDLPDFNSRTMVAPPFQWPLFVGTVIFSFEGIALVIPLHSEMREPERFNSTFGVLNIGMIFCLFMYLSMGIFSYWKFGEEIEGSVTFNLSTSMLSESVRVVVALGILLTYPIQFYVPAKLIFNEIKHKWGPLKRPLMVELLLRTGLVVLTYLIALVIPYVSLFLSLLGAVCSNALALLFPALADLSLRLHVFTDEEKLGSARMLSKNFFRYFIDVVSIILSIVGAILGSYIACRDIFFEMQKDLAAVQSK